MPQRWVVRLVIEGDLRFLSHLDCVRCIERISSRANVPLRFTQGFNPHPILSLACARPVGVAGRDDPAVLCLAEPLQAEELLERLNEHSPRGMRFGRAEPLQDGRSLHPTRITYELPLDARRGRAAAVRIKELAARPSWPVRRTKKPKHPRKPARVRTVDVKGLVESIEWDGTLLRWTHRPEESLWARADEVLGLLELDAPGELAGVVRTVVECDVGG